MSARSAIRSQTVRTHARSLSPPMPRFRPLIVLITLGWFVCRAAATAGPADPSTGPEVVAVAPLTPGALPNGFRYALQPQKPGSGRVSLRLIVQAGSLDERDNERGYAHFVEHMAFNGTRHYAPGQLVLLLQRLGLADGADLNASTAHTNTTYKLDLPSADTALLGEALQVLRDYADGIEFLPAEVTREKGVIESERRMRTDDATQISRQCTAALYEGTLIAHRPPIGDSKLVQQATADALRAFYLRCYRPERMTLVVVGDIVPGAVAKLIEANFASVHREGPAAPPVAPAGSTLRGPRAHLVTTTQPAADAMLISVEAPGADNRAGREADLAKQVVLRLLDRRLGNRRARAADRFGGTRAYSTSDIDGFFVQRILEAETAVDDWTAAVDLLETELRRAREHGFTTSEVAEAVTDVTAVLRAQCDTTAGSTPDRLADDIADVVAAGRTWVHPAEIFAEVEADLASFSVDRATATVRAMFPDESLHLVLEQNGPLKGGTAALLAAYHASRQQPLPAAAKPDPNELEFRYADFGRPGLVAQRRTEADLQVELMTFANGVRLNLRPSDFEPHHFRLSARIGRGVADLPKDKPGLGTLASKLVLVSDLGRNTREEVERLLAQRAVGEEVIYDFQHGQFYLDLAGPSEQLPFALHLLAAQLSDLRLEAKRLPEAESEHHAMFASEAMGSTLNRASTDAYLMMTGRDPRVFVTPGGNVATFEEVSPWIRTHWLAGSLEIGLVGDFDPSVAVAAAAATVGTLPPRADGHTEDRELLTLRTTPFRNTIEMETPDQAAAVELTWPVPDAADHRTYRGLRLAVDALVDRLRIKLRQEMGATYSPEGRFRRAPAQRNFGYVAVTLTFDPTHAKDLAERAIRLADEFARAGATEEEFLRLRAPAKAESEEQLRSNAWWLNRVLVRAQSRPEVLTDARTLASGYDAVTLADLNRAAARYLPASHASYDCVMPAVKRWWSEWLNR